MRSIKTSDCFALMRVVKEIGVKEEFVGLATGKLKLDIPEGEDSEKTQKQVGAEVIYSLIERAIDNNSEKKIYEFLGSIMECEPKDVADMDPISLFEKIKEITDFEQWKKVFSFVANLMK